MFSLIDKLGILFSNLNFVLKVVQKISFQRENGGVFFIRLSGFEKNDPISPKRTRQKDIVISNARQFHI